jgi:hypothetical protein
MRENRTHQVKTTANIGFCASGADGITIIFKSLLCIILARRNSVGLLVVNLYFYFLIGLQFRTGQTIIPPPAQIPGR